jgi:hypothetical protein
MGKKLQKTEASQWRKKTELVQLPSGNTAELQHINLVAMIAKHDNVPNFLLAKVNEQLNGKPKLKLMAVPEAAADPLAAKNAIEALLWLARNAFVYPKLVDGEPANDDEVNIDDIALEDLTFASNYAVGDANMIIAADRFRDAANGNVEPVPASESVGDTTE